MTPIKPHMDIPTVKSFLHDHWGNTVEDLQAVEQGEVSRVYFFRREGLEYVIRFNSNGDGFRREQYVFDTYANQGIPMPRIVDTGAFDGLSFAISERAAGHTLMSCSEPQIRTVLPKLVETFARINRSDVGDSRGFGPIQPSGDGPCLSWPATLEAMFQEQDHGFWQDWHQLFQSSFLERDVFERLYDRMMKAAKYSPSERYLVHGDFHLGNLISDGRSITGIIDWELAMYGDFVFDVATLHLWTPQFEFPRLFHEYCTLYGIELPHYEERLRASLLCKGLDSLRFYAKKGDPDAYCSVRDELLAIAK